MPFPEAWMTRRRALGGAAMLSVLAAVRAPALPVQASEALPAERLLRMFRDPGAAAVIGRAYLRSRPEERHRDRLLALLLPEHAKNHGSPGGLAGAAVPDPAELHARLRQQVRGDFATGRTVWVDGLLLARTEARLYALAAVT